MSDGLKIPDRYVDEQLIKETKTKIKNNIKIKNISTEKLLELLIEKGIFTEKDFE